MYPTHRVTMKSYIILTFLYTAISVHSCEKHYEIIDSEVHPWSDARFKDEDYSKIIIYIPKQDEIAALPDEFPIFDKIQKTLFSFFDKISKPRDDIHGYEVDPTDHGDWVSTKSAPRCNKLIHSLRPKSEEMQLYPTNICKLCNTVANIDRNSEMKPDFMHMPVSKEKNLSKPTLEEQSGLNDDASTETNEKYINFNYIENLKEPKLPEDEMEDLLETDKKKRSLDENLIRVVKKDLANTLINQGKAIGATADSKKKVENLDKHLKLALEETTAENKDEMELKIDENSTSQNLKKARAEEHTVVEENHTETATKEAKQTTKFEADEDDLHYPRFVRSLGKTKSLGPPHFLLNSGDTENRITANNFFFEPKVAFLEAEHIQRIPNRRSKRQLSWSPKQETQPSNPAVLQDEIEEMVFELDLASKLELQPSIPTASQDKIKEKLIELNSAFTRETTRSSSPSYSQNRTEKTVIELGSTFKGKTQPSNPSVLQDEIKTELIELDSAFKEETQPRNPSVSQDEIKSELIELDLAFEEETQPSNSSVSQQEIKETLFKLDSESKQVTQPSNPTASQDDIKENLIKLDSDVSSDSQDETEETVNGLNSGSFDEKSRKPGFQILLLEEEHPKSISKTKIDVIQEDVSDELTSVKTRKIVRQIQSGRSSSTEKSYHRKVRNSLEPQLSTKESRAPQHSDRAVLTVTLPIFLGIGTVILLLCYVLRSGGWIWNLFAVKERREQPTEDQEAESKEQEKA